MSYHYHSKRKKRKLKSIEKKILYAVIPLSFLIAFGIQVVIKGVPRWITIMVSNMRMEETIAKAFIKGSAVRRETKLRQDYEKSYRERNKDYNEEYIDILENRGEKELKEYQKYFEKETKESGGF